MLEDSLNELGFERAEIRLYLLLLKSGSLSVGTLAKRSGIARTTLYGCLERLAERGLVSAASQRGVRTFTAEPPEKIALLFSQRREEINAAEQSYRNLLPTLREQRHKTHTSPQFSLYSGDEGLRNVLKDMLLYADLNTCAVWPIASMIEVLGAEFFRYHNRERIRRNLFTRAIWPQREAVKIKDYPFLGWGPEFKREIRIAPPDVHFTLGYWTYANKVAYLSSQREGFGCIIESDEMVEMLQMQFEVLWRISKPLPYDAKDVESFLHELQGPPPIVGKHSRE